MSIKNKPEDVWKRIDKKGENDCWEWKGSLNSKGYGQMRINQIYYYPHRIVYELITGIIPKGLCILHTCDNRKCCNPNHLFLGTRQDNAKDRDNKNRQARGEIIKISKLTPIQIKEIRKLYSIVGYTQRELGQEFNIDQTTISQIISKKTWKHI